MFVLPTFNSVFVTVKYGIRNEIVYTCSFILVSFKFIGKGKVWGGGVGGGSTRGREWMPQIYRGKNGRRLWEDFYS